MDMVDRADEESQRYLLERIRMVRETKPNRLKPMECCYFCYEDLSGDQLFCGRICSDSHTRSLNRH